MLVELSRNASYGALLTTIKVYSEPVRCFCGAARPHENCKQKYEQINVYILEVFFVESTQLVIKCRGDGFVHSYHSPVKFTPGTGWKS